MCENPKISAWVLFLFFFFFLINFEGIRFPDYWEYSCRKRNKITFGKRKETSFFAGNLVCYYFYSIISVFCNFRITWLDLARSSLTSELLQYEIHFGRISITHRRPFGIWNCTGIWLKQKIQRIIVLRVCCWEKAAYLLEFVPEIQ